MTIDPFPSLESCIRHWREQWSVPGIVVGIYRNGDVSLHADGVANLNTGWLMREDMLFRIASISKVFTATLAMTLVDEGKLDLDAPVRRYLPNLRLSDPEAQNSITMRHLLSHSSGLYGDVFDDYGMGEDALARFVDNFHSVPQLTKPGELWHYGNSGFDLAGMVITSALDTSFESAMRERLFKPLGMNRSGFFAHEMTVYPYAVGHETVDLESHEHRFAGQYYPRSNNPSGAVITNAEELLRFASMHLEDGRFEGKQLLSPGSARSMREPQIEAGDFADYWGIGWQIRNFGGATLYGHGGSSNGFITHLTLLPEEKFAFCVLTNGGRGRLAINPIRDWILQQEFGLVHVQPEPADLDTGKLERLAGTYTYPHGTAKVQVEHAALRVRMWESYPDQEGTVELPPVLARPLSLDKFIVTEGNDQGEVLNFFPRGSERPTFLRRHGRLLERVE